MQQQKSYKQATSGALYLVPTPIGNLEDMTFRAVKILNQADLIASEDTRNTQKLLNHFEIQTPQKSFHEHNYQERIPQLLNLLTEGKMIAQVSDAGMPSISDPGQELVAACLEQEIPVISLPGPTAGLTALIASGLKAQPNLFYGFLPRKKKAQQEALAALESQEATIMFYESPHRVHATLSAMVEVFGPTRQAVICRELTKIHEEYLRGTLAELVAYTKDATLKGECCLLVSGKLASDEPLSTVPLKEQVEELITQGMKPNAAIKEVAKKMQVTRQEVYAIYHELT